MSAKVNDKTPKRNLPSWMSSTSRDDGDKSGGNKSGDDSINEGHESGGRKRAKGSKNKAEETGSANDSSAVGASNIDFSRLMEGVVFVLSGFVNPERSILRSQGLEMGAEYQPDWNSNCTLLVCAFQNTPKFRQVEAECGTIVSKEWIKECYSQKKLVEIDNYLMYAGKPWRKSNISQELVKDTKMTPPKKTQKQEEGLSWMKPDAAVLSEASEGGCSKSMVGEFSPSKVKKWAVNDLNRTILWLESQEEKPEPSDMKKVAVEGILTCLQDAIDLLDKKLDMQQLAEQWNFLPQVVEELVKRENNADGSGSVSKEGLHKQAASCKKIYEHELNKILNESDAENKDMKTNKKGADRKGKAKCESATGYDSDETIEMTQEEIDLAFKTIASEVLIRE